MTDFRIPPNNPAPPVVAPAELPAPAAKEEPAVVDRLEAPATSGVPESGPIRAAQLEAVFDRTDGWTGADGTYSVPLKDGRVLFLFSDTILGTVDAEGRRAIDPKIAENDMGWLCVNNTAAIMDPGDPASTRFLVGQRDGLYRSLFDPPDGKGWLWIGGTIPQADGSLTVLLNQFVRDERPEFRFGRQAATWAVRLRVVDDNLSVDSYHRLPELKGDDPREMVPGAGVLCDGKWAYIYNSRAADTADGPKRLSIARAPIASIEDRSTWKFFTGTDWSPNANAARLLDVEVFNELSVTKQADGYLMTSSGAFGVCQVRHAPSPVGPWTEPMTVWDPPEQSDTVLAYGAKAHPHLSDERGLVISYNVNTVDLQELRANADIYRPRFIRVPWSQLAASRFPAGQASPVREVDLR